MRSRALQPAPPDAEPSVREVARLAATARLAGGAAHALYHGLRAIAAEASYLRDERKEDPLVSESCDALLAELDRCAALARKLLPPRRAAWDDAPVALCRLVRSLGELLQETLGGFHQIQVHAPAEPEALVRADRATLELLILCLVHHAADQAGGESCIQLEVEAEPVESAVALRMRVRGRTRSEDAVAALADPARASDPTSRAMLAFVAETLAELGGRRMAAPTAPDAWAALIHLPAAC